MRPIRFVLAPSDVAAGFRAAGTTPPKSAFYDGLPPPSSQMPRALTGGVSGELTAEAKIVFQILANPQTIVALECLTPPSPVAVAARFVVGASPGRCVMTAHTQEGEWDIALLTSTEQLIALLDELAGVGLGPSADSALSLDFDLAGLTALAALADQAARCEALERLGKPGLLLEFISTPVPTNDLIDAIEQARVAPTTLQAVTLLSLLIGTPLETGDLNARIQDGVETLAGQGVVRDDSTLTPAGIGLCRSLSRLRTGSSLHIITRHADGLQLDRFLLLRTDATLLVGLWTGADASSGALKMREMSAGALWRIVGNAVGGRAATASAADGQVPSTKTGAAVPAKAAAPQRQCTSCGRELRPLARFCTSCGAQAEQA